MNDVAEDERFAIEPFFERVKRRLEPAGDHLPIRRADAVLNPEFVPPANFAPREAAVLIPIVEREVATVLLTRRTVHLRKHAGQIAFPGGKLDPTDAGPVAAALREAQEEIGLDPRLVEPVGRLDPYLAGTGFRITAILGRVSPHHELMLNPDEVDSTFEVPLSFLMTPDNHQIGWHEWQGRRYSFYEMPFGDYYIWGVTAGILRGLYERLFQ